MTGFGLSVMYAELIVVFNAKRSDAALVQSVYMGIATGGGIIFSGMIRKVGPGISIVIGSVVCCIGLLASSFATGLVTIIMCTGVISASGMCVCYLSAFMTVSWVFHENASFYLVSLMVGSSIGQFVIPIFYELFITEYSWSGAFIVIAGFGLQCIPFGLVIHFCKDYFVTGTVQHVKSKKQSSFCDITLLKDFVIWILWINFHLLALTGNAESWFIVDLMVSRGFSRQSGSVLVSAIGIASLIGRLMGGVLRLKCTKWPTLWHWLYLCPITAATHVLVVNFFNIWSIMGACIAYGISFGAIAAQAPAVMFEASGLDRYPQGMAMVNLMYGFGNVFSGLLGGYIRDTVGDYDIAFYIAAGTSLYIGIASAVAAFFFWRRNQRASDEKRYSEYTRLT
ncbi:monocarboxylate transporter 6-like isoform X2 [Mercenaria mercenaria]|uniref:monocarboxylate transporter 6-like isoform X2 n=1 Tax=Mercenaria mercenaria TaxID=6596 RepID=UPI00234E4DEF|nr:monocarboxylate transporter 6-like isoform X2 [Mercenaria mercenaria]